jgi:hypothetical protein
MDRQTQTRQKEGLRQKERTDRQAHREMDRKKDKTDRHDRYETENGHTY